MKDLPFAGCGAVVWYCPVTLIRTTLALGIDLYL